MGVAVFIAIAELLHQLGRRVAQVQRHLLRALLGSVTHSCLECGVHRIALRRTGQIDDGLGHGKLAFRTAQALLHVPGIEAQGQGARIGVADILTGHAHHTAGDVQRVAAAIEHARVPVQRAVRAGTAHRLVQRGNLVVEGFAALVETTAAVAQQVLQQLHPDFATVLGQVCSVLEKIEQTTAVTIGSSQKNLKGLVRQAEMAIAQAFRVGKCAIDQLAHRGLVEALEHIDASTRQQRIVQFERGILGGSTDEDQRAVFHVGQERVLLALVEAMHLVDEENGATAVLSRVLLGHFDGLANLLDAGEHGGNGLEMRIGDLGQQARQGGLAYARRPPEDHRVQGALLQRLAQRLARRQHMLLADVFVQAGSTQTRSQGLRDGLATEQIHALLLDDVRAFRNVEGEQMVFDRLVHLHIEEQDVGALTDAVDQLHVVEHAIAERQPQAVEQAVLGLGLENEVDHAAAFLVVDLEVLADLRDIAGEQQRGSVGQTLIECLNGDLLQIRVVQPDLLAIGDQQLLHGLIGVPTEHARTLERQLPCSFLQLSAAGVEGQLREARTDGLRLAEQFAQALGGRLFISLGGQQGKAQSSQHQQANNTHINPLSPYENGEATRYPALLGSTWAAVNPVDREFSGLSARRNTQSRDEPGASTSREPLVFIELTTPAISIASIIRAARL